MQSIEIDTVVHHFSHRPATGGAPCIVFINSLGTDFRIWDGVVDLLEGGWGVLRYDMRGHGLTGVGPVPYTMDGLAGDLASLLHHNGIENAVICGVSVGGQVAQQLYHRCPHLVSGLVLCNTAAKIGEPAFWARRIEAIARDGLASVTDAIMERWFSPEFRASGGPQYSLARAMFERQPVEGYLATCEAIAAFDRRADAKSIACPVAVLVGSQD